ncbi:nucleotide exchange factor GrpE [Candidatus Woesearchaeota archaeon]|nr:MAG: nucleotide exchange factor GrpE [Candidatus Woesearchaeota archaeon]
MKDKKSEEKTKKTGKKEEKSELEKSNEKIIDLTSTLQRLQADFENYKRRTETEKSEFMIYSNSELIKKLLPLLDNFEIALKNTEKHEEFIKGIELIFSQFIDILKDRKVERIKSVGEKLDPNKHEALMAQESNEESNMILEEFQSGYTIGEKILRPAKVKVSK